MRVFEKMAGATPAFAGLSFGPAADPAFGGYLVLRPATVRRRPRRDRSLLAAAACRVGGLVAILLSTGLGVATLARDASGPHPASLDRFAYSMQTPVAASDNELSGIFAAMVLEPQGTIETSAITTAAITPLSATPRRGPRQGSYAWLSDAAALPARLEPLKDTGPKPLQIAAAAPANDGPGFMLPQVEVQATAVEEEANAERSLRKRPTWQRRHRNSRAAGTAENTQSNKKLRMPRWAQQMYDNPWQSKAFSYMR